MRSPNDRSVVDSGQTKKGGILLSQHTISLGMMASSTGGFKKGLDNFMEVKSFNDYKP